MGDTIGYYHRCFASIALTPTATVKNATRPAVLQKIEVAREHVKLFSVFHLNIAHLRCGYLRRYSCIWLMSHLLSLKEKTVNLSSALCHPFSCITLVMPRTQGVWGGRGISTLSPSRCRLSDLQYFQIIS